MPFYEFICTGCKAVEERQMKVTDLFPNGATEAKAQACPKCGAQVKVRFAAATLRMGSGTNPASTTPKKFQH